LARTSPRLHEERERAKGLSGGVEGQHGGGDGRAADVDGDGALNSTTTRGKRGGEKLKPQMGARLK
jgi:hypothetical protein